MEFANSYIPMFEPTIKSRMQPMKQNKIAPIALVALLFALCAQTSLALENNGSIILQVRIELNFSSNKESNKLIISQHQKTNSNNSQELKQEQKCDQDKCQLYAKVCVNFNQIRTTNNSCIVNSTKNQLNIQQHQRPPQLQTLLPLRNQTDSSIKQQATTANQTIGEQSTNILKFELSLNINNSDFLNNNHPSLYIEIGQESIEQSGYPSNSNFSRERIRKIRIGSTDYSLNLKIANKDWINNSYVSEQSEAFISYRFVCAKNYYGSSCETLCVPQNDNLNGHYNCSSDGLMQCLPCWHGKDCKKRLCQRDCEFNCRNQSNQLSFNQTTFIKVDASNSSSDSHDKYNIDDNSTIESHNISNNTNEDSVDLDIQLAITENSLKQEQDKFLKKISSPRIVPGTCKQAYRKCALREVCAPALRAFDTHCKDLLTNQTNTCSSKCIKAIVRLRSYENGQDLFSCDCQSDYNCLTIQQQVINCEPQVEEIINPSSIVSCSVASLICLADQSCATALRFYQTNCKSMLSERYCSRMCNTSLSILHNQSKAKKLMTCKCDGLEDFACIKHKSYSKKFCLQPNNHLTLSTPEEQHLEEEINVTDNSLGNNMDSSESRTLSESEEELIPAEEDDEHDDELELIENNWIPMLVEKYLMTYNHWLKSRISNTLPDNGEDSNIFSMLLRQRAVSSALKSEYPGNSSNNQQVQPSYWNISLLIFNSILLSFLIL